MSETGSAWQGRRRGIHIKTIANVYSLLNTVLSSVQLLCYTVLRSALHVILEKQKKVNVEVCDMSTKNLGDSDDCELKASKIAAALLALSIFEVLLSFLALRGAYASNVFLCYIWFAFTGLLVIVFPLYQTVFFIGTNWWDSSSYSILSLSVIHSAMKLCGMYIMVRLVKWMREESATQRHTKSLSRHNRNAPPNDPSKTWTLGEKSNDSTVSSTAAQGNDIMPTENILEVEVKSL